MADAVKSVVAIENVRDAIGQIAQTTLRKVVGQHTMDQVRAKIINAEGESLAADSLWNVDGDNTYVRVQVLTNAGALNRAKQR